MNNETKTPANAASKDLAERRRAVEQIREAIDNGENVWKVAARHFTSAAHVMRIAGRS